MKSLAADRVSRSSEQQGCVISIAIGWQSLPELTNGTAAGADGINQRCRSDIIASPVLAFISSRLHQGHHAARTMSVTIIDIGMLIAAALAILAAWRHLELVHGR